jgi:lambda family phage tail tape measure protein
VANQGESLGTAYLTLSVDTADYEARVERAKSRVGVLGDEAQKAFTGMTAAQKKAATSLANYTEIIGKSADETKILRAAMQGVDAKFLVAAATRINATREDIAATARVTDELGASWVAMQAKAKAAANSLRTEAAREAIEAEARAVKRLADQEALLALQREHAASGAINAQEAARNAHLIEQKRVVAALTDQFHALEAAEAQAAQGQQFVASLQSQAAAVGKTRSELLEMKAAELGVTNAAAPFIAKLKEQEVALTRGGIAFNAYGLSAKQTAAALRQVPAQMTDIFVSLQGGQNPLTVLLQQGGQLKDVFGGVVPAARALGSALLGLVNPITVSAAAIAAFAYAITQAQDQQGKLENALLLTGNAANTTSEQLAAMAKTLDDTTNASERHASAVVASVAATGRFTAEQIAQVSKAALEMEEATGRSVQQTIQDFAAIGDDPVAAIQKLNNAVGDLTGVTNFLTAEQYKQIEAMNRSGDAAGAAKILWDAYADAIETRAPAATENLSSIARAWLNIKKNAGDAGDAALKFFSEALSEENMRATLGFQDQFSIFQFLGNEPQKKAAPRAPLAAKDPVTKQEQDAYLRFQQEVKGNLTDQQRQNEELNRIRVNGNAAVKAGLIDVTQVWDAVDASEKAFAEAQARKNKSGAGAARSLANAQSKADLQEFKDILLQEQDAIQNGTQILQAQYAARLISAEEYYTGIRGFTEQSLASQEKALEGEIAALRGRNVAGKDSVDTLRKIGELEAQLAKVRADSATKLAILTIQEQDYNAQREESIRQYADALNDSNDVLADQFDAQVRAIGQGKQEWELQERIAGAYRHRSDEIKKLAAELRTGRIDQSEYDREVKLREEATKREVEIVTNGYDAMRIAEADWLNGLKSGITDWIDSTKNVAAQIAAITTKSLDTASDALAEFALTSHANIKKLLADILSELVKFFAKRAVLMFVEAFLGGSSILGSSSGHVPSNLVPNAKGNPFTSGTTLPSNTVLTRPTMFKFARGGQFGVAGEAGAEAVMPLERGADGKLGVRASGTGNMVNMKVETNVYSDGSSDTKTTSEGDEKALYAEFSNHMQRVAKREVEDQMRPGGSLWRAGVRAA